MRAGACRWLTVWLTTVILVAGCVSAGSPTTPSGGTAALPSGAPTSTDAGPFSPPPSPTPSPTADPRPPLEFPDLQSHGTATLLFGSPAIPPVTFQLACFWTPGFDATLTGVEKLRFRRDLRGCPQPRAVLRPAGGRTGRCLARDRRGVRVRAFGMGPSSRHPPPRCGELRRGAGDRDGRARRGQRRPDERHAPLRGSRPRSRDRATGRRSCSPTGPSRWAEIRPWPA